MNWRVSDGDREVYKNTRSHGSGESKSQQGCASVFPGLTAVLAHKTIAAKLSCLLVRTVRMAVAMWDMREHDTWLVLSVLLGFLALPVTPGLSLVPPGVPVASRRFPAFRRFPIFPGCSCRSATLAPPSNRVDHRGRGILYIANIF